jgi:hypothetical protein
MGQWVGHWLNNYIGGMGEGGRNDPNIVCKYELKNNK